MAAATAAPLANSMNGRASTSTTMMMTAPITCSSYVRPRLDLHEGADRQRGHGERGTGGAVVAECLDVGLVHRRVVVDVGEEHRRLRHVRQRRALALQQRRDVGNGLRRLALDPAADERTVGDADLARA